MGKKGPLWWRESDWLLRGSSAANQILLRHSGPILSDSGKTSFITREIYRSVNKANLKCVIVSLQLVIYFRTQVYLKLIIRRKLMLEITSKPCPMTVLN